MTDREALDDEIWESMKKSIDSYRNQRRLEEMKAQGIIPG